MNKEYLKLNLKDITPYGNNPRHNDGAVAAVKESIKQCGYVAPIIVDEDNIILAGHTRHKALKSLKRTEVEVLRISGLTEEQKRKYRLLDNKTNELAEWDFDLLGAELEGLDFDGFDFGFELPDDVVNRYDDERNEKTLQERFLIPPFSVFDSRQRYWQERKREWLNIGIKSENGRGDSLTSTGLKELAADSGSIQLSGTSIFDPVLCEIAYKWFCTEGGYIFDPFAGGSVRGIVASYLGYHYKGIDLRQEQIDANYENASDIGIEVEWFCDDSLNQDAYIDDDSVDMIFSCPPYADLEVYSNDPRDISNMDYESFLDIYNEIIHKACGKLKNNRFAVWVVGDVRDKNGYYRNFVDDTKNAFISSGMKFYNDIILLQAYGTAALRAAKQFQASRKVVKMHQNVLVFYKGDSKCIKDNYRDVEVAEIDNEEA